MATYVSRLRAFWAELDPRRRTQLGIALAVTLAVLVAVGVWSSTTSWTPLLQGRAYDELLDAAAALDQAEVRYRIRDGALEVADLDLGKARAALATTSDLPGLGDVGELQLGLTPAAQAWAFLRAREGDLARVINGIEGVAASRVHIVPKREALFLDEEEPARASVFVRLRPGRELGSAQVRAISNLVSGAVDGLSADRVAIVDDRGNLLAEGAGPRGGSGAADLPSDLLGYRAQLERRYERAVSQALLPVLGFDGGFSVTATVDVDLTSSETVTKRLDADTQALLTEQIEESNSQREEPGGVPGVDANLPERPAAQVGLNRQEQSATTASYAYPTVDEIAHRPAGEIERVSVAVQVDSARIAALADAAGVPAEDIQARIEQAVKAAVGADAARNDVVAVHFLPFTPVDLVDADASAVTLPGALQTALPYAVAALAIVLAFVFVVRPLVASATRAPEPEVAEGEGEGEPRPDNVVSLPEEQLALRLRRMIDDFEPIDAADLSALVAHQPQAAAKVLKMWQREA